jgi:hypothetical protein
MSGGRAHRLVACLGLTVWLAAPASPAAAFGTIDGGGQHREHERITRAALACADDANQDLECFEPASTDLLAGHDRGFGAVGAPDSDEISDPAAHCDGADFLETGYPRTRDVATAALLECVDHLRVRFGEAVDAAGGLLDGDGQVVAEAVDVDPECAPREAGEQRAKCTTLDAFGRILHGAQDFYAHSNWADEADPTRPIGADNPPGLDRPGPSPVLDLRTGTDPTVPADLITGCFVLRDEVPGVGECTDRVTHAALNKDNGLVDPATGDATGPTTPRGMVGENFAKAVAGAISESRRQWQDLRSELTVRYGQDDAARMACALTHDDPVDDCRDRGWLPVLVRVGAVVALAVVPVVLIPARRRGSARPVAQNG